ncbi:four-helix bundle copper-binding protein [Nocardia farcinica]|uniref:four-helix bundle copper-binding protein n=1 Tax=Nocardia farcinica TaxID=37329 RepID=UPI00313CFB0A
MTQAMEMLETFPADLGPDKQALADCIEECFSCAQACTACADACVSEPDAGELVRCIGVTMNCAEVCDATGRVLSRHSGRDRSLVTALLRACVQACATCADECAKHSEHHEHCRVSRRPVAGAVAPVPRC